MTGPPRPFERGGGVATTALLSVAVGVLGVFGDLPYYAGAAVGVVAVFLSANWRARRPASTWALAPALGAVTVLAAAAPVSPALELLAGLSGLAFLLWIADDPERPVGGGRRAAPSIAPAALAVGLAWVIALGLGGRVTGVGAAGALVAAALVVLALLFASVSPVGPKRAPTPSPPGGTPSPEGGAAAGVPQQGAPADDDLPWNREEPEKLPRVGRRRSKRVAPRRRGSDRLKSGRRPGGPERR